MKIAETSFVVLINQALIKFMNVHPDVLLSLARHAAQELDVTTWANNEQIMKNPDKHTEGLDCYSWPVSTPVGQHFTVEITPFPFGVLRMSIGGRPDTVPVETQHQVIAIKSTIVMEAPLPEDCLRMGGNDGATAL